MSTLENKAVLVTGATGLVGSHLLQALTAGARTPSMVRALVRPGTPHSALAAGNVEAHLGDLREPESLASAVSGMDVVFHCGALLESSRPADLDAINAEGTAALVRAAGKASVETVVHVSSIGVYGVLQRTPADEEHPCAPIRPYSRSKLSAEQAVERLAPQLGIRHTILRPVAIIGVRDRTITPHALRLASRRWLPLPGGGRAAVPLIDARDVARALILAAELAPGGGVYNVQGFTVPLRDVLAATARRIGSRMRIVTLPVGMARAGAWLIDAAGAVLPGGGPHASAGVAQLSRDMIFDTSRIETELGFKPRYDLASSLPRAIDWCRRHDRAPTTSPTGRVDPPRADDRAGSALERAP